MDKGFRKKNWTGFSNGFTAAMNPEMKKEAESDFL